MRVGVYVDGYNLYYGGRHLCGGQSWKWLSPRDTVTKVIAGQVAYATGRGWTTFASAWGAASVARVVFCTARIDSRQNPSGFADQDVYLKALLAAGAVDHIEYGNYVARTKVSPLALNGATPADLPQIVTSRWPMMVKDSARQDVPDAVFLARHLHNEEKGSDVNVASHLLVDVLSGAVDAAVVVSNDSDLRYPVAVARGHVPVGVVNPRGGMTAGALRPPGVPGSDLHWTRKVVASDILNSQMPSPVGAYTRPAGW